jgi:hypothetical protein
MKVFLKDIDGSKPQTGLVLRTIRVGFPTWTIQIERAPEQTHWNWIKGLIARETESFVICDPDVVFFDEVEADLSGFGPVPLAGEHIPAYWNALTGFWHRARLHTALMAINPMRFKAWGERPTPAMAGVDLVSPHYEFKEYELTYCDTMTTAYEYFLDAKPFGGPLNAKYEHLNAGTWLRDCVPATPEAQRFKEELLASHEAVYQNIENARGLRKIQQEYYRRSTPA